MNKGELQNLSNDVMLLNIYQAIDYNSNLDSFIIPKVFGSKFYL